jgi:hypothetical protein
VARLWDEWKNRETGERLKSCTMIVGEPNEFASDIHDLMPVFLTEQQFASWLNGEQGAEYLKAAPNDYLQRWPVSKRVNSSKADADDPTLIDAQLWPFMANTSPELVLNRRCRFGSCPFDYRLFATPNRERKAGAVPASDLRERKQPRRA